MIRSRRVCFQSKTNGRLTSAIIGCWRQCGSVQAPEMSWGLRDSTRGRQLPDLEITTLGIIRVVKTLGELLERALVLGKDGIDDGGAHLFLYGVSIDTLETATELVHVLVGSEHAEEAQVARTEGGERRTVLRLRKEMRLRFHCNGERVPIRRQRLGG